MRKPKLRELGEAIKAIVKGPYTDKFPFKPANIAEEYKGFPEFQEDGCVRCGGCVQICPVKAIKMIDEPETGKRIMFRDYSQCIQCGQCAEYCLTSEGIVMTTEWDKTTLDPTTIHEQVEDDLVFCESCAAVITTKKHMDFIIERLGELAYSNPSLVMHHNYQMGLADKDAGKNHEGFWREDYMRILCPNCRRNLVFKEEWGG
ncbi:4Fe-4S binding protein [bacterium]|nr:4Fe-4S binding protein [bacterium]